MSRVTKPDKSVSPKPAVKLEKSTENHFSIVHRFGFFETDRPVKPKQMRPVLSGFLQKLDVFFLKHCSQKASAHVVSTDFDSQTTRIGGLASTLARRSFSYLAQAFVPHVFII
jgi:hypothetical protein